MCSSGRGALKVYSTILSVMCCVCANGCAIHYFYLRNGTHHLWGNIHMRMKVAPLQEQRIPD